MILQSQGKTLLQATATKAEIVARTSELRVTFIQEAGTVQHSIELYLTAADVVTLLAALSLGLQSQLTPKSKIIQ